MKFLFLIFSLLPCFANAQVTDVHEVAKSTETRIQTISVCNVVLDVANATSSGTLAGAYAIEVYTTAASTNTVNCGFDVNLSTNIHNAAYGREVPAGVGVYWAVIPKRKLYCLSQNSAGCTRATVTQFK